MQNDALMHREGLKGSGPGDSKHHIVYPKTVLILNQNYIKAVLTI